MERRELKVKTCGKCAWALVLCAMLTAPAGGCAMHRLRGPETRSDETTSVAPLRRAKPGDKPWGFDSRAREIERSLGYQ